MIAQIFQNSDTTTNYGIRYPLIHWRRFRELKEELDREYKDQGDYCGKKHYAPKGLDIYVQGDLAIGFESRTDDEELLKKVLGWFDLPRDSRKCIVAHPKDVQQAKTASKT